jgi:hypothetical protein
MFDVGKKGGVMIEHLEGALALPDKLGDNATGQRNSARPY